jgi:toxin-antitoxin system PIN domain toxin
MKSYFPDINLWLALAYQGHQHHPIAATWFNELAGTAGFCRITQIGFLRLLTHPLIMGDETKNQKEAWAAYDRLIEDSRVIFYLEPEPHEFDREFRSLTSSSRSSAQQWPDAYLAAFARVAGLTLVTFDRALSKLLDDVLLLK